MTQIKTSDNVQSRYALFVQIAEKFAREIWKRKEKMQISDLVLYGSVARSKQNPNDLDILLIHYNPALDIFQDRYAQDKKTSDIQKLLDLTNLLENQGVNLSEIVGNSGIVPLISKGEFNSIFMNEKFFTDQTYRNSWRNRNCWDPNFDRDIIETGKLYDSNIGTYSIPAISKYPLEIKLPNQLP